MQLSKYISELLYRYECVMVPNFGGFVSNTIPSKRNAVNHQFTPPSSAISFNINLQQNDGLLVNHISKSLNISFDVATNMVQQTVDTWKSSLENTPLLLNNIGQLSAKDGQITFEPLNKINYLTSSFGLSDVDADYILRNKVITPNTASNKSYGKYIAAAAIVAGLFFSGSIYIQKLGTQQEIASQNAVTTQIQQASFNILQPLPAVKLTVEKKEVVAEETTYKYHVIAGAFKEPKNALKKVSILAKKGFNASIIGINKWGLTQVSYASFNDKTQAVNSLTDIRKKDNKHAWLLVNE